MINHVVPPEDLERFTFEIAGQVAETSPLCVALMKEELRILSEARPLSPESFERLQAMRRDIYNSRDYEEGIRAFLERRPPVFGSGAESRTSSRATESSLVVPRLRMS